MYSEESIDEAMGLIKVLITGNFTGEPVDFGF